MLHRQKRKQLPILVQRDEDGCYIVECPVFEGCYAQGETLEEAMKNIREVIDLVLEEEKSQRVLREYGPFELSLQTIMI